MGGMRPVPLPPNQQRPPDPPPVEIKSRQLEELLAETRYTHRLIDSLRSYLTILTIMVLFVLLALLRGCVIPDP